LPQGRYWDIPDTEEIQLDIVETTHFPDRGEGEVQRASKAYNEIPNIKRNQDEGRRERSEIPLGLCQWKDDLLWYQGKIWIPNKEER